MSLNHKLASRSTIHMELLDFHSPLLHRYQLNKIVVDTEAGPYRNRTVLFLGSSRGTILKFLIMPNPDNTVTNSNVFLEELEGFNPDK